MLNREDIKKIIPHRDPFLLVDKITEMEPLKRGVGYLTLNKNMAFFQGHFPEEPVMPGVLIIEALSQVGATVLLSDEAYKGKLVFMVGADNLKFRRKVSPGETLRLEVEVVRLRGNFGSAQGKAYVGDELAAEGLVKFAVG
jgi:3-hydroxyacyl-[acyl-carrier-protein] dehydratase